MVSSKTPQDAAAIFARQQLWHLNGEGKYICGYFESLHTRTDCVYQPMGVLCVCDLEEKKLFLWLQWKGREVFPGSDVMKCWSQGLLCPSVCLSFKDSGLISNHHPGSSTYRGTHVSRSFTLRCNQRVKGLRLRVFVVRLSDTQICTPIRKLHFTHHIWCA